MSASSITPAPPGTEPSPFDPMPWPPWEKVTAAGAGEFYGAMVRQLDGTRESTPDPVVFGKAQLAKAKALGTISAADERRLAALITLAAAGDESEASTSAAKLFQETLDDPSSSPLATTMLSIAKYKEETETETQELDNFTKGYILGMIAITAPGPAIAIEVASHIHVTYK